MSKQVEKIGILGAGGQADEVELYLRENGQKTAFRAVSRKYALGAELLAIDEASSGHLTTAVVGAVGAPGGRKNIIEEWPGSVYATIIALRSVVYNVANINPGTIIAPGAILTSKVDIGQHVLINTSVTIGHDCMVGEFSTISPGVNIGGHVNIGRGVFIGIGATIKNGVTIADGVVVGAGSVVIRDILEENSVHVGVPSKKIGLNESWLHEI